MSRKSSGCIDSDSKTVPVAVLVAVEDVPVGRLEKYRSKSAG
jgi:hypothetical protein